jgi:hypothetical protein
MSMIGELSFFLGMEITQRYEGIFLSQEKYLREILKRFQMEDSTPVRTPMVTGCKLRKDGDSPNVDQSLYRCMIGNLLYITTSHPDIMHGVGMVGRYQSAPVGMFYRKALCLSLMARTTTSMENRKKNSISSGGEVYEQYAETRNLRKDSSFQKCR